MTLRLVVAENPEELAACASDRIMDAVAGRMAPVLGVATGSSPLGIYAELARRVTFGSNPLARASIFALDEYVGFSADDSRSYAAFVRERVVRPLGIDPARVFVPNGAAVDADAEAARFEAQLISSGGVDVQVVGIGSNGHLGFNEPDSPLNSGTRVVTLSASTRSDNVRYFDAIESVPTQAITQGLATIGRARAIILVAQGEHKARALAAALFGPVSPECPASVLQLHADVTVVIDGPAAQHLPTVWS